MQFGQSRTIRTGTARTAVQGRTAALYDNLPLNTRFPNEFRETATRFTVNIIITTDFLFLDVVQRDLEPPVRQLQRPRRDLLRIAHIQHLSKRVSQQNVFIVRRTITQGRVQRTDTARRGEIRYGTGGTARTAPSGASAAGNALRRAAALLERSQRVVDLLHRLLVVARRTGGRTGIHYVFWPGLLAHTGPAHNTNTTYSHYGWHCGLGTRRSAKKQTENRVSGVVIHPVYKTVDSPCIHDF